MAGSWRALTGRVGRRWPTRPESAARHHFHGAPVVATRAPIATAALTAITFIRILITPAFLLSIWGSPLSWRGDGCDGGKSRRRAHNRAEVRDSANHQMICSFRVCGPRRERGNRGGGSARAGYQYIARSDRNVTQELVIDPVTIRGGLVYMSSQLHIDGVWLVSPGDARCRPRTALPGRPHWAPWCRSLCSWQTTAPSSALG